MPKKNKLVIASRKKYQEHQNQKQEQKHGENNQKHEEKNIVLQPVLMHKSDQPFPTPESLDIEAKNQNMVNVTNKNTGNKQSLLSSQIQSLIQEDTKKIPSDQNQNANNTDNTDIETLVENLYTIYESNNENSDDELESQNDPNSSIDSSYAAQTLNQNQNQDPKSANHPQCM